MRLFASLASSSSGNAFIIAGNNGIALIDTGISAKQLTLRLNALDISPGDLSLIIITHEHRDHIHGLRVFTKQYNIPIYAPIKIQGIIKDRAPLARVYPIEKHRVYKPIDGWQFVGFELMHDAVSCFGYRLDIEGVSLGFASDLGYPNIALTHFLSGCDYIALESNYDRRTLLTGPYPPALKQRIISHNGHLDNNQAMNIIRTLNHRGLKGVFFIHLSRENNSRDIVATSARNTIPDINFQIADPDSITIFMQDRVYAGYCTGN